MIIIYSSSLSFNGTNNILSREAPYCRSAWIVFYDRTADAAPAAAAALDAQSSLLLHPSFCPPAAEIRRNRRLTLGTRPNGLQRWHQAAIISSGRFDVVQRFDPSVYLFSDSADTIVRALDHSSDQIWHGCHFNKKYHYSYFDQS